MPVADRALWPWWAWTIAQAAVVIGYAEGWRPAGGYPTPVADTADLGLAVVQVIAAASLGPCLLAGRTAAVRTGAAAVPFVALAAGLAQRTAGDTLKLALVAGLWTAALTLPAGRRTRQLVLLLAVAGPVLWYVALEYGGRDVPLGSWPTLAVPTLGVCSTGLHGSPWRACIPPAAVLIAVATTRRVKKIAHVRGETPA